MSLFAKLSGLKENISLSQHTTFRIGGPAKYFLVVRDEADFKKAVRVAREAKMPFYVLGGGSNMLVADQGFAGLVIKIQNVKIKSQNFKAKDKIIEVEAGFLFNKLIIDSVRENYAGIEWGFGIPGTIGGAICGNAGRLGEDISGVVRAVRVLDKNLTEKELTAPQCAFGYRESRFKKTGEIILGATLRLRKKEPTAIAEKFNAAKAVILHSPRFPSAGCAFKNYQTTGPQDPLLKNHPELEQRVRGGKIGVGFLIDQAGMKGQKVGGAQVWDGHANYIINTGGATAADVRLLMRNVTEAVGSKYGLALEPEVRFLGF
ncbi:MAG: UDP-N-acetylenolpyruvoylglucosamine reductase [Candidatus Portnoybacteria bacterium CG10_big_fil_rev_8_21_14_0_10_44_7]|uniref:UDP-N-acetylenolpyruvoylglucosamine reductase n=1 Tax=Candidatus Portnoybacteria bacterium CG10_big_fil_rev_8_21_14_0_10_44_7 TaxID=1974816 RepID=A0A2M8KIN9_9BACT|nr:MAG: UDP-N-acetylenolpyruvoylglucosamine reductase [Candidatus Portnoybacteria bacterium CG10_big_fil_rev_8_21_14_0_10_44_7]